MLTKYTRIYVVQQGSWWSFTPEQWIDFLELRIRSMLCERSPYTLPDKRQLTYRPSFLRQNDLDWYSPKCDHKIVPILNLDYDGFVSEYDAFKQEISEYCHFPEESATNIIYEATGLHCTIDIGGYQDLECSEYVTMIFDGHNPTTEVKEFDHRALISVGLLKLSGSFCLVEPLNKLIKKIL